MLSTTAPTQSLTAAEKRMMLAELLRKKAAATRTFPLSFAQRRLWFLHQLAPASIAYNAPLSARFTGPLDVEALERSFAALVRRHESLRTTFRIGPQNEPIQVVSAHLPLTLPVFDLEYLPEEQRVGAARQWAYDEARQLFDLTKGPLLRAKLLRLGTDDHVVIVTMHHIVSDGWSLGVLLRDLIEFYTATIEGRSHSLADLSVQYGDFATWQQEWLQNETLDEQLRYWKEALAGAPEALELPTDMPRPCVQNFAGAQLQWELPLTLVDAVRNCSQQQQCTPFMTFLASWQALLHRYTGQDDICVGTPIANRNRAELEGLIGFFVNTLAMRGDLSGDPSFSELLAQVRQTALEAYAHQDLPFERLVEELQPHRNLSRSPLCQVLFVYQNSPLPTMAAGGMTIEPWEVHPGTSKFDLSLFLVEREDRIQVLLEFATDLFERTTAELLGDHWQRLLAAAVERPDLRLSELPLLSEAQERQLLV